MDKMRCWRCKQVKPLTAFYKNQRDCKSCQKVYRREYYKRNKEKYLKRSRQFREKYPEKTREYVRKHYKEHAVERRAYAIESYHRRRALKSGKVYDVDITIEALMQRDDHKCGLCGGYVEWGSESIDHILPISRGGLHVWSNVQITHRVCNSAKGNCTQEEYDEGKRGTNNLEQRHERKSHR